MDEEGEELTDTDGLELIEEETEDEIELEVEPAAV